MFKKALYAGAIFCVVAAMTACGNKKADEQVPATDTAVEVVGEVMEDTTQNGDTVIAATEEAVLAETPATNAPADKATKDATVKADSTAQK